MRHLRCLLVCVFVSFAVSCLKIPTAADAISTSDPTWITMTWSGGATGNPIDVKTVNSTNFKGTMCNPNNINIQNRVGGFNGLRVQSNCSYTVSLYMCVAAGSGSQPVNGLPGCHTDPLKTNMLGMHVEILPSGGFTFINATPSVTVNVVYCSSSQSMAGPGMPGNDSSQLKCIGG